MANDERCDKIAADHWEVTLEECRAFARTGAAISKYAVRWLVAEYDRQGAEIAELRRRLDEERLDKAKFLMGAEGIR